MFKTFIYACLIARRCALEGQQLAREGYWAAYAYAVLGAILLVPLWAAFLLVLGLYLLPLAVPAALRDRRAAAKDDRYQNQPWEVQVFRWWRYKPYAAFRGACAALYWLAFDRTICEFSIGEPEDEAHAALQKRIYGDRKTVPMFRNKREMLAHVYCLNRNCWQYGLKHYYTMQEVKERIEARGN
jgi:hypothetical protein